MRVSIIGAAGTLGSCTANAIAVQGLADELVLFDQNKNLLKCHILDLETAVSGINGTTIREGEDGDLSGSDVVVMCASIPNRKISDRMELFGENLRIVVETAAKVGRDCPDAVVLIATNPVDPLTYAWQLASHQKREKVLGYSFNDTMRFRMFSARALGVPTERAGGFVVGEHGENMVMAFSSFTLDGQRVALDESVKESVRAAVPNVHRTFENLNTGRTAGWTTAVGISAHVAAIAKDSGEVFPCAMVLGGEYGFAEVGATLPVALGRGGITEIVKLALTDDEEESLRRTLSLRKEFDAQMKGKLAAL